MRIDDRSGHKIRRFIGGVAKHHPLIAGALAFLLLAVDALGNIGRLAMQMRYVIERIPAEILLRAIITDFLDHTPRYRRRIDL